jgi:hypothetical protein
LIRQKKVRIRDEKRIRKRSCPMKNQNYIDFYLLTLFDQEKDSSTLKQ